MMTLMPFVRQTARLSLFHDPDVPVSGRCDLSLQDLARACRSFRRVAAGHSSNHRYTEDRPPDRPFEISWRKDPEFGHRFLARRVASRGLSRDSLLTSFLNLGPTVPMRTKQVEVGFNLKQQTDFRDNKFCEQDTLVNVDGTYSLTGFHLALAGDEAQILASRFKPFELFFMTHVQKVLSAVSNHTHWMDVEREGRQRIEFQCWPCDESFYYGATIMVDVTGDEPVVTSLEIAFEIMKHGVSDAEALIKPYRPIFNYFRRYYLTPLDRALPAHTS